MKKILSFISNVSHFLNAISAFILAFMVLLTVADVVLRSMRSPILGTYEMVGLLGAIIISFSIPVTSWQRGHIKVDFLVLKLPSGARKIFNIVTRIIAIALFIVIGWNIVLLGMDLKKAGEVTPTRHIPYYPVLYSIGFCCFFQCLVLIADIVKVIRGEYE
ncbi:MAG: TRAP transporter small permease [Syntrophorhabdaceae bacterium]|nr:TRAP transporter small permease [Syntrophorhabdaceae bacterium]